MRKEWKVGQDLESLQELMSQLRSDLESQANSRRSIRENRRKERTKNVRPPNPEEWKSTLSALVAQGKSDLTIGYWRVSLDRQVEGEGPETQQRFIVAWATAQTSRGIDMWVYDVDSGKEEGRLAFDFLMQSMELGCVKTIVTFKYDRIARNQFLSELMHREARKHGVRIRSATEDLPEGPVGDLMRQVLQALAQYEAALIVMRMVEGKRTRLIREGTYQGGEVPYGYVTAGKGHLLVCEPEARIVRLIFALYARGYSQSAIADSLNRWEIPTRLQGKMGWRQGQIRRLLSHESEYRAEKLFSRTTLTPEKIGHQPILSARAAGQPNMLGNVAGLPRGTQVPDDLWGSAIPQARMAGTLHRLTPEQASTLATMFHLRDEGLTIRGVAEEMNRRGLTTLQGKGWRWSNVQQYLRRRSLYDGAIRAAEVVLESGPKSAADVERRAIETILALRRDGLSYWQIRSVLDGEGMLTASARPWSVSSIQRVVKGKARRAVSVGST